MFSQIILPGEELATQEAGEHSLGQSYAACGGGVRVPADPAPELTAAAGADDRFSTSLADIT